MSSTPNLEKMTKVGLGSPILINWELVSHCQFKCTYCYYKPFESNTDYESVSGLILKKLSTIKDKTKVTLLGGEPSLHPTFLKVVAELHVFPHVFSIPIVTNFDRPLDFWMELLPYKDKVKIVVSIHIEYPQKELVEKVKFLQKHFAIDLVFVVHYDTKFLPKMNELAKELHTLDHENVTLGFVRIHKIADGVEEYAVYPESIEQFICENNEKTVTRKNTERVNVFVDNEWKSVHRFELINKDLNRFTGWSCQLRAFIIHHDATVSSSCSKIKKHILLQDFKETTLKCSYKICECDDYWEFPKIKNEAIS